MLREKMMENERKILLQLIKDSRQPVSDIASKLGITRQTVAKKIDDLEKLGIITSYTTIVNPEKVGLGIKAYVFVKQEPNAKVRKKNEEILKEFSQISKIYYLFGRYDMILEILANSKEELTRIIKGIHKLKGIKETETFIVHSTAKYKLEDPFIKVLT